MCLKIQFCIQRLFVLFCSSSKSLHSNTHVIIIPFYANIFIDPVGIVPSNLWQIAWQLEYSLFIIFTSKNILLTNKILITSKNITYGTQARNIYPKILWFNRIRFLLEYFWLMFHEFGDNFLLL